MKITVKERLNEELLGTRQISSYKQEMLDDTASFYGRDKTSVVQFNVYGVMENEIQNDDGTYTYDYSSFERGYIPVDVERKPEIKQTIKELMYSYGIKNFIIDDQEEVDISDYYAAINIKATYLKKSGEARINGRDYKIVDDDYRFETKSSNEIENVSEIEANSIEELNEKLEHSFSEYENIQYLKRGVLSKEYHIKLALDQIAENLPLQEYIYGWKLRKPKFNSFEEAIEAGEINDKHIEEYIMRSKGKGPWIEAGNLPTNLLEKVFERRPELCDYFKKESLPAALVRKYSSNFDVMRVNPNELQHSDLTAVLHGISHVFGHEYKEIDYLKYFEGFYDETESLKEILVAINRPKINIPQYSMIEFLSRIPKETLTPEEIRDTLINADEVPLNKIMKYGFDYDEKSSRILLKKIEKSEYLDSDGVNSFITTLQNNGISNGEILETLRNNEFKAVGQHKNWARNLKELGITGIKFDDIRNTLLEYRDFSILNDIEPMDEKETSKEFEKIKGRKDEVFKLLSQYSNTEILFSKLDLATKSETKKLIIDNLDLDENVQKDPYEMGHKIINILASSFDMSVEDFMLVSMKLLNCGATMDSIMSNINEVLPENQKEQFNNSIEKSNIYPSPKHFWLKDRNLKRIYIGDSNLDREAIKKKIQSDGKCFSIKLKTDLTGTGKNEKPIAIDNLSKWLFGVPKAKGHLTITKNGNYIQLPSNTPDEAVDLIKDVLIERKKGRIPE